MAAFRLIRLLFLVIMVTMVIANIGKSDEEYDCHKDPSGKMYRGDLSKTWGNHTCRSWTDVIPAAYHITAENYPYDGLGDHNYCRSPGNTGAAPWCFTVDITAVGQYCELGQFHPDCRKHSDDPHECFTDDFAKDYTGQVNVTRTGIPCQKWSVQRPQPHPYTPEDYPSAGLEDHNYCRNPAPHHFYAWCYTTKQQVQWDFCDIGLPSLTCSPD